MWTSRPMVVTTIIMPLLRASSFSVMSRLKVSLILIHEPMSSVPLEASPLKSSPRLSRNVTADAAVESRALTFALRFKTRRMATAVSSGRKRMMAAWLI